MTEPKGPPAHPSYDRWESKPQITAAHPPAKSARADTVGFEKEPRPAQQQKPAAAEPSSDPHIMTRIAQLEHENAVLREDNEALRQMPRMPPNMQEVLAAKDAKSTRYLQEAILYAAQLEIAIGVLEKAIAVLGSQALASRPLGDMLKQLKGIRDNPKTEKARELGKRAIAIWNAYANDPDAPELILDLIDAMADL